jgi:2-polyprenyl-3-methyl-5-hydroxy-6-metoxy-1,4-benzoquinol methylase
MSTREPAYSTDGRTEHLVDVKGRWLETSGGILYVVSERVQFDDDLSHWRLAFQRLLEINENKARSLIETAVDRSIKEFGALPSELPPEARVKPLTLASAQILGLSADQHRLPESLSNSGTTFDGSPADHVFAGTISGNRQRMVIGNRLAEYAWQIETDKCKPVAASSVAYDRSYYESPRHAHCGMRDYIHHDDWRLEKSRRLMRIVTAATKPEFEERQIKSIRALDVGSATGYYRKAMEELGYVHYGIDLSREAIAVCKETFGYETWHGSVIDLARFVDAGNERFNLITLWDTIEHFDDPGQVIRILKEFLSDEGMLVVRTPSLTALEAEILKDMYYSFKLDHVRYFSPKSLTALMRLNGLQPIYIETTSHLFKGLLGANYLYQVGQELRGADIVAIYKAAG